ncbi:MAG TPA: cyclic nucleotide-binding domain-containing protein, partial [Terriglobales bacterium]|nr:cyclic nucleotide-binding domain-containing protein [Terriglobales bacterium]
MAAFKLIADTELRTSLCSYASSTLEIKAREYLFHQGEDARGCYLVVRGVLSLFMEASSGRKILGREVGEGCIVGLPATINGNPLSLSCRVIQDAELRFLSRDDLMTLMRSDVGAAMKI